MVQFPVRVLLHESGMGPLEIRRLFRTLNSEIRYEDAGDHNLKAGYCLGIWVASLLRQLKWLDSDQRFCLLEACRDILVDYGSIMGDEHAGLKPKRTQCQLLFLGAKYATWTGSSRFLDLRTGEYVDRLPYPEVESVAYNLTELFRRETARCTHLQIALSRGQDAGIQLDSSDQVPGSLDEP